MSGFVPATLLRGAVITASEIEPLLRGLPAPPGDEGPASEAFGVRLQAAEIAAAFVLTAPYELPRARAVGNTSAKHELEKIADCAVQLGDCLESLHRNSVDAINKVDDGLLVLRRLSDELDRAVGVVEQAGEHIERIPPAGPLRRQAFAVTAFARSAYEALTERPATVVFDWRTGKAKDSPFGDFLEELYGALGIKAKPKGQIKKLRARMSQSDCLWPGVLGTADHESDALIDRDAFDWLVNRVWHARCGWPLEPPRPDDEGTRIVGELRRWGVASPGYGKRPPPGEA